jgi:hypothetical protein
MLYPKPFLQMALKEKPALATTIWQALNQISTTILTGEGRVYGGGLHKLEPKELGNVPAGSILAALEDVVPRRTKQLSLAMEKRDVPYPKQPRKQGFVGTEMST